MEVYRNKYVAISIHAPASGATIRMEDEMSVMENFNPRSREWSDHSTHPEGYRLSQISIHAPASGATMIFIILVVNSIFQSTLPRVERQCRALYTRSWSFISIHAPASGATYYTVVVGYYANISIHAPASGATIIVQFCTTLLGISIHAPASGATAFIDIFSFTVRLYFISSH